MTIDIFFCGDIVNVNGTDIVDSELKSIISEADLSVCNFEAPVKTNGANPINKAGPHLSQSSNSIAVLKDVGFNILSLANNHIYDYGDKGLENTISLIEEFGLLFLGAGNNFSKAYEPKIIDLSGIRIGFISVCEAEFGCLLEDESRGGYAWINHYMIEDNIRDLKNKTDLIILNAHSGIENIDIPLIDWRKRYKRLCDIGVDVIIGHHPHVPQGYEYYSGSWIFYSLGNFYFDCGNYATKDNASYSVLLKISKDISIDFEIIYHKKKNGVTSRVDKNKIGFSLNSLNKRLNQQYEESIHQTVLELYKQRYELMYINALASFTTKYGLREIVKFILRGIFFRRSYFKKRHMLLLHNIRIESHRYLVQRALSILFEK